MPAAVFCLDRMLIHGLAAVGTTTAAVADNLLATAGADGVIHLLQLSNSGGSSQAPSTAAAPPAGGRATAPPRKGIVKRRTSVLPLTVGAVAPVAAGLEDAVGGVLLPLLKVVEGAHRDPRLPGVGYSSSGLPLIVSGVGNLTWKEAW